MIRLHSRSHSVFETGAVRSEGSFWGLIDCDPDPPMAMTVVDTGVSMRRTDPSRTQLDSSKAVAVAEPLAWSPWVATATGKCRYRSTPARMQFRNMQIFFSRRMIQAAPFFSPTVLARKTNSVRENNAVSCITRLGPGARVRPPGCQSSAASTDGK